MVALSSLLLSLSLSPCRPHPVFIFCLAILLAFCLLFSAMRQLLSDIEKLGCGCHTRAPNPISVSCVCRGAEARIPVSTALLKKKNSSTACMHACRCLRRSPVSNRPATAQLFFPALSRLLSSWSRILTVAPVFSKVNVFLDKGLKSSRKFACFSGPVEALWIVLSMVSAFSEHSL